MLALSVFGLSACGGRPEPENCGASSVPATEIIIPTTQATEYTKPDDGSIKFYYDDRISFTELGGTDASAVRILEQQVDSCKVGSNDPDDAVPYYDEAGNQLIAVGVGTATVDTDGTQMVYNAAGFEIAENLCSHFRTDPQPESIEIYTSAGIKVKDELVFKRVGVSCSLIVEVTACYVSNFSIELSDNLQLISPFTVKATAAGEGHITISRNGEVIRTISVTVED